MSGVSTSPQKPGVTSTRHLTCLVASLPSRAKNKNLANLQLNSIDISDENWSILCQSAAGNPTLQILEFSGTMPNATNRESNERKIRRTKEILAMLKKNTALELLRFGRDDFDNRIRSNNIILPHLHYRQQFIYLMGSCSNPGRPQMLTKALRRVSAR